MVVLNNVLKLTENKPKRFVELHEEDVEHEKLCTLADAEGECLDNGGKRLYASRHHTEGDTDEHDAEGDDRDEAAAEGRREERPRDGEQRRMRRHRQQQDDHHVDRQQEQRRPQGHLLAIAPLHRQKSRLLQAAQRNEDEQQPHEQRRGYDVDKATEEPPDALAGEQRAHALGHRCRKQPRDEDEDDLRQKQDHPERRA